MSQHPHDDTPRNELPEERGDSSGRSFPLLAPTIFVGLALVALLVYWLAR